MMQHVEGCKCMTCAYMAQGMTEEEAFAKFHEWERDMILKHGWLVHFCQDARYLTGANYHTHGVSDNFDHPDFQIVFPIRDKTCNGIFADIVEMVKGGRKFKDGDVVSGIIKDFDVKFIDAEENDRPVLRVILPDPSGNLEAWQMEEPYNFQYEPNQELTEEEMVEGSEDDET